MHTQGKFLKLFIRCILHNTHVENQVSAQFTIIHKSMVSHHSCTLWHVCAIFSEFVRQI